MAKMNCFLNLYPLLLSLFTLAITLTHALPTSPPPSPSPSQSQSRPYSNHTFLAAHNSPFIGPLPQQNQNLNITDQLSFGIRFLQGQTHRSPTNESQLQLCHTSCALEDGGPLVQFLETVRGWLLENPGEVVSILLTNGDRVGVEMFGETFRESGIEEMVFVPETNGDDDSVLPVDGWPSVEELVGMGKRVVVFLDYGANTSTIPYILDEFAYFFETPFGETDPSFPNCSIDRPPGASPDGRMYIVNHVLNVDILGIKVPDRVHAARTNAVRGNGSIGAQANLCRREHGRVPNVVLVDFVEMGEVMEAQDELNRG